jgi:beta-glucosidase
VPLDGYPRTAFGWPVVPDGLRELLVGLRDRYGDALPEIAITENGCSYEDIPGADGVVNDTDRIAYYAAHLDALRAGDRRRRGRAGTASSGPCGQLGVGGGLHQRFGLVHVDSDTRRRTPKSSYVWFRDLISRPAGAKSELAGPAVASERPAP